MPRLLLRCIAILLLPAGLALAQGKEDFNKALFEIKQKYIRINSYKDYRLVTIDDAEQIFGQALDNGASLTGYYNGDTLVKMVLETGLSNKMIRTEYYLNAGKLFFALVTERRYVYDQKKQDFDYTRMEQSGAARYYFFGGKLINTIINPAIPAAQKQKNAAALLRDCTQYSKLLGRQKQPASPPHS